MIYSIVVTYNGAQWIEKCLSSLINSTVTDHHVLVVDNNSTDSTVTIIKEKFTSVELIESDVNFGFGKANNIGMKKAVELGADFVFLLNQDAWVEEDTIDTLVKIYEVNSDYGILSPIHLDGKGGKLDYKVYENVTSKSVGKALLADAINGCLDSVYDIDFINAAVWLLPIHTIKKIGFFDSVFFHYGEDCNYAERVVYKGLKVGVSPLVKAFHDRVEVPEAKMTIRKYALLSKAIMIVILCKFDHSLWYNYVVFSKYYLKKGIVNLFEFHIAKAYADFSSIVLSWIYLPRIVATRKRGMC